MGKNYTETLPDGTSLEMIFVEGGKQRLVGINFNSEKEQVLEIDIPSFHIGQFPVTQALWESVIGENLSRFKGANRPVERVDWEDAQVFLQKLNTTLGITENGLTRYRLPSEVKWQYAAMGGQKSKGFVYAGSNKLKEVGWYRKNSHRETKAVGLKKANELGIYDMSGNVGEWCEDNWQADFENSSKYRSAWKNSETERRAIRGGAWFNNDYFCRVSDRFRDYSVIRNDYIGFRVARY